MSADGGGTATAAAQSRRALDVTQRLAVAQLTRYCGGSAADAETAYRVFIAPLQRALLESQQALAAARAQQPTSLPGAPPLSAAAAAGVAAAAVSRGTSPVVPVLSVSQPTPVPSPPPPPPLRLHVPAVRTTTVTGSNGGADGADGGDAGAAGGRGVSLPRTPAALPPVPMSPRVPGVAPVRAPVAVRDAATQCAQAECVSVAVQCDAPRVQRTTSTTTTSSGDDRQQPLGQATADPARMTTAAAAAAGGAGAPRVPALALGAGEATPSRAAVVAGPTRVATSASLSRSSTYGARAMGRIVARARDGAASNPDVTTVTRTGSGVTEKRQVAAANALVRSMAKSSRRVVAMLERRLQSALHQLHETRVRLAGTWRLFCDSQAQERHAKASLVQQLGVNLQLHEMVDDFARKFQQEHETVQHLEAELMATQAVADQLREDAALADVAATARTGPAAASSGSLGSQAQAAASGARTPAAATTARPSASQAMSVRNTANATPDGSSSASAAAPTPTPGPLARTARLLSPVTSATDLAGMASERGRNATASPLVMMGDGAAASISASAAAARALAVSPAPTLVASSAAMQQVQALAGGAGGAGARLSETDRTRAAATAVYRRIASERQLTEGVARELDACLRDMREQILQLEDTCDRQQQAMAELQAQVAQAAAMAGASAAAGTAASSSLPHGARLHATTSTASLRRTASQAQQVPTSRFSSAEPAAAAAVVEAAEAAGGGGSGGAIAGGGGGGARAFEAQMTALAAETVQDVPPVQWLQTSGARFVSPAPGPGTAPASAAGIAVPQPQKAMPAAVWNSVELTHPLPASSALDAPEARRLVHQSLLDAAGEATAIRVLLADVLARYDK